MSTGRLRTRERGVGSFWRGNLLSYNLQFPCDLAIPSGLADDSLPVALETVCSPRWTQECITSKALVLPGYLIKYRLFHLECLFLYIFSRKLFPKNLESLSLGLNTPTPTTTSILDPSTIHTYASSPSCCTFFDACLSIIYYHSNLSVWK